MSVYVHPPERLHSAAAKCYLARPGALGRAGDGARLVVAASVIGRALRSLACGGGVRPVSRGGSSGHQINHDLLCQMLREVLTEGAQAGSGGAGGIGSVECRAAVTLYSLLLDHPVDQWGRCRSCRRPGSVLGVRWRPCQVHSKADLCLRRLDEVLLRGVLARQ